MAPAAKRRKVEPAVEEISFDLAARQEFLTGFHKRKVQRAKYAQEKAEQKARQDRIEERKRMREERKAELERHVKTVNEMLKPAGLEVESSSDEDDEDEDETAAEAREGITDPEPEQIDHEAEYVDEDKYTTVTVEAMDVTRDGLSRADQDSTDDEGTGLSVANDGESTGKAETRPVAKKRTWTKERPPDKPKRPKRKRNFKYEGRIERKVNRAKERVKNRKQAQARKAG